MFNNWYHTLKEENNIISVKLNEKTFWDNKLVLCNKGLILAHGKKLQILIWVIFTKDGIFELS